MRAFDRGSLTTVMVAGFDQGYIQGGLWQSFDGGGAMKLTEVHGECA